MKDCEKCGAKDKGVYMVAGNWLCGPCRNEYGANKSKQEANQTSKIRKG